MIVSARNVNLVEKLSFLTLLTGGCMIHHVVFESHNLKIADLHHLRVL